MEKEKNLNLYDVLMYNAYIVKCEKGEEISKELLLEIKKVYFKSEPFRNKDGIRVNYDRYKKVMPYVKEEIVRDFVRMCNEVIDDAEKEKKKKNELILISA
ncbi:hypothetical protein [Virgibacillus sp. DJP39]|uniref:hypothetical protein n=1 Tax=Virgibacillus sp. DJP39 TaxID=3409790 RepID=UPI003BB7B838